MNKFTCLGANEIPREVAENRGLLLIFFGSVLASENEANRARIEAVDSCATKKIRFVEVEVALEDQKLIKRFGIEGLPTLVLYKDSTEVERWDRFPLYDDLTEVLDLAVSYYL